MKRTRQEAALEAYHLIGRLPCHQDTAMAMAAPGIYIFFEQDECLHVEGRTFQRVVRVGKAESSVRGRLDLHYQDTRRWSVFRRHMGSAVVRSQGSSEADIASWYDKEGRPFPEVEDEVSKHLKSRFTFACFPVARTDQLKQVEEILIRSFSLIGSDWSPSEQWMGRHANHPAVRNSGLWCVHFTKRPPPTANELHELRRWLY